MFGGIISAGDNKVEPLEPLGPPAAAAMGVSKLQHPFFRSTHQPLLQNFGVRKASLRQERRL